MNHRIPAIAILLVGASMVLYAFFGGGGSSDLKVEIKKANLIMPAAHRVYENPKAGNGKYHLFKAKITNEGNRTLEDVVVRYRVPGFIDWTEIQNVGSMIPGQSIVAICYPKFDEKITTKMTESMEKVELEIDWDGASKRDVVEESFGFKMLSRNDFAYSSVPNDEIAGWSDMFDNDEIVACFVTPNDPVVKYYTQVVQEKVLKGEAASVYNSPEMGVRFLTGLYDATLMAHMVYSGTKGVPQSLDDLSTMVQHVRLPREVITGNTGLCIELSALYASVMSAAGMDPIIYLVPGHAYPGFKMNGQYFAIEATGIGGEGLGEIVSSEVALEQGMKQLDDFIKAAQMGDPRYSIVDVHEVNAKGITSMALEDNDFMRKKIDEIAANFQPKKKSSSRGQSNYASNGGSGSGSGSGGGGLAGDRYPGPLSFVIPNGWMLYNHPEPSMPILTSQVVSADMYASVAVFDIPASSPQEALNYTQQAIAMTGQNMQYSLSGSSVNGTTYGYSGAFNWKGRITNSGNGYRLVTVGTFSNTQSAYGNMVNQVYNSIK